MVGIEKKRQIEKKWNGTIIVMKMKTTVYTGIPVMNGTSWRRYNEIFKI